MKYMLDTEVYLDNKLTDEEVYYLMILASKGDVKRAEEELLKKGFITRDGDETRQPVITDAGSFYIQSVLVDSETSIPKKDRCAELAAELQQLFPKGMKTGSAAWRGNKREITLRLQKFFKLYDNKWTDEEIIEATKKYINHFNGNYTYMRILKYFIMKSEVKYDEEGTGHIEDNSELATWLENDPSEIDNDSWLTNMV